MSDELLMDNYLQTCRKHNWSDFQVERTWEKIANLKKRKERHYFTRIRDSNSHSKISKVFSNGEFILLNMLN